MSFRTRYEEKSFTLRIVKQGEEDLSLSFEMTGKLPNNHIVNQPGFANAGCQ